MRFKTLDGWGPQPASAVFRWAVFDKLAGRRRKSARTANVPFTPPDPAALARPPAPGEPPRLTWLGHASWLVQLDGASLLIDPVFSQRISYLIPRNVPPPLSPPHLPPLDA